MSQKAAMLMAKMASRALGETIPTNITKPAMGAISSNGSFFLLLLLAIEKVSSSKANANPYSHR